MGKSIKSFDLDVALHNTKEFSCVYRTYVRTALAPADDQYDFWWSYSVSL